MNIETQQLQDLNAKNLSTHKSQFDFLTQTLSKSNVDVDQVIKKLADFQVAIPSWALGAGGTRFGRFSYGGEPASLEQKIEDIGLIHKLTQTAGAVSLHIPWDVPEDYNAIKE
ncbi:MAG: sugar isomerase, partial [Bacteroidota bacterium]|nr:sugar isomerase [Bacteroidota bacterium]